MDARKKASLVLATQGYPATLADGITEEAAETLALHVADDGRLKYAADAQSIAAEFYESVKATVEDE